MVRVLNLPSDQQLWFCTIVTTINMTSSLCCTLLLVSMTFERFYSIIRPHKAASFNTVKRAKVSIVCVVIFSIVFNITHMFITAERDGQCVPYAKAIQKIGGQIYYWISYVTNFALPFVLLLLMNSVIIHTLRKRSMAPIENVGQDQSEGQTSKTKKSETQTYLILLLVAFAFLVLTTPGYVILLYVNFIDYTKSAYSLAEFHFTYSLSQKFYYTNFGINFYLYITSGKKFRKYLLTLLKCNRENSNQNFVTLSSDSQTIISTLQT